MWGTGGQHRQLGSEVKAFETNDRYVVAGDATASYIHGGEAREGLADLPEKVSLVTRSLSSSCPITSWSSTALSPRTPLTGRSGCCTAHEPAIEESSFVPTMRSRLFCRTLLPEDAVLTPVGGLGREFWAAGQTWTIKPGS